MNLERVLFMFNSRQPGPNPSPRAGHPPKSNSRYRVLGIVLALLAIAPLPDNPLIPSAAYAHGGGGGAGGGGGGGKGAGMVRKIPGDGHGKSGRGFQGMK